MPRRRRSSLDKNKDSTPLAVEGIPLRNRWLTWQADPTREKIPVRRRYPDARVDKLTLEVATIDRRLKRSCICIKEIYTENMWESK